MAKPAIYYDNRFDDAAVRASSTAAGYAVANVTDWRPYTWWKAAAADATLTVNCGAAASADYGLIIGHNLGSQGATIDWQSSADGSSWTTRGTESPTDDGHLLTVFASVSAQYWRASISGAPGAAAIDWRFAADKALPSAVTFTRASTATYFDADGVLRTAAINEARFDHNPETGQSLGLLIEESRTNLLTRSQEFDNAAWAKTSFTITPNATTAPDGSVSAEKAIPTSTASPRVTQNVTLSASTTYTLSAFFKAAEYSASSIRIYSDETGFFVADFNLATGTVTPSGGATAAISALGNDWFRVSVTGTMAGTVTNGQVQILRNFAAADSISGLYVWGAQLEAGAFPTSYIPTTSATVTRSADLGPVTGSNFSGFYNQSAGTFLVESVYGDDIVSTRVLTVSDGTSGNRIGILGTSSGSIGPYGEVSTASTIVATLTDGTAIANTRYRAALAYTTNDIAFSHSGRAVVTDTSAALPTVSQMQIGADASSYLNGHISRIAYWPSRLTNTQLQWLSAAERPVFANPTIAIAAVGAALELYTYLPQGFDPTGRQVESSVNRNANGQPLGRIIDYERWEQTITQQSIPWAWIRSTFDPAWSAHLRSSPFAFCWEPSSYADEVRLVVAGDRVDTPHRSGLLADLSFDVSGVLE